MAGFFMRGRYAPVSYVGSAMLLYFQMCRKLDPVFTVVLYFWCVYNNVSFSRINDVALCLI